MHACRVLGDDGVFISVTFAQPHFRRRFVLAPGYAWGMHVATFGEEFHYFVYTMRKGQRQTVDVPVSSPGATHASRISLGVTEAPMHEHMDREDYLLCMDV